MLSTKHVRLDPVTTDFDAETWGLPEQHERSPAALGFSNDMSLHFRTPKVSKTLSYSAEYTVVHTSEQEGLYAKSKTPASRCIQIGAVD